MAVKKIMNLSAPIEYTTKSGEKKTSWKNFGKLFIMDDGKTFGKIDTVPVGWDGSFNLFEDKKDDNTPHTAQVTQAPTQAVSAPANDGLPF